MKYYKLVENAGKPSGFWGRLMIRSMNKGHSELTEWALSKARIQSGCRALDVGCGGGININRMAEKAKKIYGVDYSIESVKLSREVNRDLIGQGKVEVLEGDDDAVHRNILEYDDVRNRDQQHDIEPPAPARDLASQGSTALANGICRRHLHTTPSSCRRCQYGSFKMKTKSFRATSFPAWARRSTNAITFVKILYVC